MSFLKEERELALRFFVGDEVIAGIVAAYLLVLTNFFGDTFSCDLQRLLTSNVYVKHAAVIIAFFFLIATTTTPNIGQAWLWTIGIYVLYMLSVRKTVLFTVLFLGILFAHENVRLVREQLVKEDEDGTLLYPPGISYTLFALKISAAVVLLVGFLHSVYVHRGRNFKPVSFMLGKDELVCPQTKSS